MDPDLEQVKEAHKIDAQAVEINTASYADARDERTRETALRKVTTRPAWGASWGSTSTPATA